MECSVVVKLFSILLISSVTRISLGQSGAVCRRSAKVAPSSCTSACAPSTGCPKPNHDCLCDGDCGYSCVPRDLSCGRPPRVRNAKAKATGSGFGATASYTCNDGYTVIGAVTKRCSAKGIWGGALPSCMKVCKLLKQLPFGARIKSPKNPDRNYRTGESISLECKQGFRQEGTPQWRCVSGRWTKFPFKCTPTHSCKRTVRAAFTRCTRECSPLGDTGCLSNQECLCDGQCGFSCVEKGMQCPEPPVPPNGVRFFSGIGYNATVKYKCNENYTLTGNPVRRCTAKKTWEGLPTNCLADCSKPKGKKIPSHAYIANEQERYRSGERVTFSCNKGYNQEGLATMLCFLGEWKIMPFKCVMGGCGNPGVPEHGSKTGLSYSMGKVVLFSCTMGYRLEGSNRRRCGEDNQWSGTQPRCIIIDCGKVDPPQNGSVSGNQTTFQKAFTFSCDAGFEMDSTNPTTVCQSDGRWSNRATCSPVDCGLPDAPAHGTRKGSSSTFTSQLVFSCDAGYIMSGSATRTCLKNASWSGTQPTCTAVNCGSLDVPRNGSRQGTKWTYPNSVSFACHPGFELQGTADRKCEADGQWSGNLTQCHGNHNDN